MVHLNPQIFCYVPKYFIWVYATSFKLRKYVQNVKCCLSINLSQKIVVHMRECCILSVRKKGGHVHTVSVSLMCAQSAPKFILEGWCLGGCLNKS